MAGKLPRVTEYIKNVGKSIGYASIDAVKESTEGSASFLETNDEFFKTIYSAAKNYKQTLKAADAAIKKSKLYDAAVSGIKATKEDLASGNWYNKKRDSEFQMAAFGDEFADFSDFEVDLDSGDWNMDDDEDIISKEPTESKSDTTNRIIAQAALGSTSSIVAATREQSRITAASAENIANVNMATAKMLSMQNEKLHSSLLAGFQDVHGGLNIVIQTMTGPMTTFMNESTKFYEDVSNKFAETNAYLKELTEMQRNLYKAQQQEYKQSKYDEIVDSNDMPDLKAYGKQIFKNIKNLDPTGGMLFGDGDENMIKAMLGSPLKFIPTMIIKNLIPNMVKSSMTAFDESLKGLFPNFIAKMNKWAQGDNGADFIDIKGIIGSILGVKTSKKEKINTGNYQRGPMPFDGETKKAIVDVIPAYLARIEAALSGRPERTYDFGSGTFKTDRDIHKAFKQRQVWAYEDTVSSIQNEFDAWAKNNSNIRTKGEAKKRYRRLGKAIYDNQGRFDPFDDQFLDKAGFTREEMADFVKNYLDKEFEERSDGKLLKVKRKGNRKGVYEIAGNTMRSQQDYVRYLEEIEGQFGNPIQRLFNGSLMNLDDKGRIQSFDATKGVIDEKNLFKTDKRFRTTNDYLRDILANIIFIRENGLPGSGKKKGGRRPPSGPIRSIDDILKTINEQEGFEEEELKDEGYNRKEEKEKTDAERYGLNKENLKKLQAAKTFDEKVTAVKDMFDKWLQKPAEWITNSINKADKRLFDVMFGSEEQAQKRRDREGREYNGFLDYLVTRTSEMFDDLTKNIKSKFEKLWDRFKQSSIGKKAIELKNKTMGALSNKFSFFKTRGTQAYNNTYGIAANAVADRLREHGIIGADDVEEATEEVSSGGSGLYADDFANAINNAGNSAFGRVVQKYGLSMVSPGEIIIPNRGKGRQRRDLKNEKREKNKILQALKSGRIGHHAQGTVNNDSSGLFNLDAAIIDAQNLARELNRMAASMGNRVANKASTAVSNTRTRFQNSISSRSTVGNNETPREQSDFDALIGQAKRVIHEVGGQEGDIIADSLIGGGVSLLTGAIGGPLLGAAVGASYGLVKNSDFLQEKLFGKRDENGERDGKGLIPKSVTDFFKKHSEGMIDFGAAGAVAGLFTPLGLVGGAMAGAALGYAKDTKAFKDFMFGNEAENKEGLMSKETQEKIKKAFPAIATGATAGILLGPFGLVGNVALGSVAGYASTTDTFQKIVLGETGDDGKRHGGVVGAFKEGLVKPLVEKGQEIVKDLAGFALKHIVEPTELMLKTGGQFVKNVFTSIGDRITDSISGVFERHVGMPMEEFLREKVFKRISNALGSIVKVPLNIAKGVIGAPFELMRYGATGLMMSQIRRGTSHLESAEARNAERAKHRLRGRSITGRDNYEQLDAQIAGMNSADLSLLGEHLGTFIKNRGSATKAYNDKVRAAGDTITANLRRAGIKVEGNAYTGKKQILEAIQRGEKPNLNLLQKYGLDESVLEGIDMDDLMTSREDSIKKLGLTNDAIKQLEKVTGIKGLGGSKNHDLRNMLRVINKEAKYKSRLEKQHQDNPENEDLPPLPEFNEKISDNTTKIVDILTNINEALITPPSQRKKKKLKTYNPDGTYIENGPSKSGGYDNTNQENVEPDELDPAERGDDEDMRTGGQKFLDFLFGNAQKKGVRGHYRDAKTTAKAGAKWLYDRKGFIPKILTDGLFGLSHVGTKALDYLSGEKFGNAGEIDPDSLEGNEIKEKEKKDSAFKELLLVNLNKFTEFAGKLSGDQEEDDHEEESLISRIFHGMGDFGSNILGSLGKIGGGLKTAGIIGAGVGGLALLGWGSKKLAPWFEEKVKPFLSGLLDKLEQSETFQKIKGAVTGVWDSWKDGTLVSAFVNKTIQGVSFAFKNVIGPLTESIIASFPDLILGIGGGVVKGIGKLLFGNKTEVRTNLSGRFKNAASKIPTGKDEKEFASSFSGKWNPGGSISEIKITEDGIQPDSGSSDNKSSNSSSRSSRSNGASRSELNKVITQTATGNKSSDHLTNYKVYPGDGTYTNEDGSTSVVSGDMVERYDKKGNFLGRYDQTTGYVDNPVITHSMSNSGGLLHASAKSFGRSLATGSPGLLAKLSGKLGGNISTKGIIKSFTNHASAGGFITGAIAGSAKTAAKVTGGAVGSASNLGSKLHEFLTKTGTAAVNGASDAAGNWGDWIANNADDVAEAATTKSGWIAKGLGKIGGAVNKVATSDGIVGKCVAAAKKALEKVLGEDGVLTKFLVKHFGKAVTPLCKTLVQKSTDMIAKGGIEKVGGKLLGKLAANTSPLALYFWGKALADGFTQTESILGIAKETIDLPFSARVLATLVHALNENIFFGLIPTSKVMDMVLGIFGDYVGISTEDLEQARDETANLLAQAGIETGKTVTINDYNHQTGMWTKLGRAIGVIGKNPMDDLLKDNNSSSNTTSDPNYVATYGGQGRFKGRARRGGSQGGMFASLPYGKSTIGEAGCAPVAASMIGNTSVPDAAMFAQRTGHVAPDGSTDIGFFNDYFSARGISHRTTTDKSFTEKALRQGGSAVLLGRDPGGGDESAYSDSSHFITARGMDRRGNVVIDDPELGTRVMKKGNVFRNMRASVVTGRGRYRGRGRMDGLTGTERREIMENDYNKLPSMYGMTGSERREAGLLGSNMVQNGPSAMDCITKIINVARGEVGNKEIGRYNSNNIKYNTEYYGREVSGSSYPWCGVFMWWCFRHSGLSTLYPTSAQEAASCGNTLNWYAARRQVVKNPQPGDLIFFNFDGGSKPQHIGICSKASTDNGNSITCIEGNTSTSSTSGSQDNGGCVAEKNRKMKYVVAVARPAYNNASFDDVIPDGVNYNYSTGEESSSESSGPLGLFEKLAALGKTAIKALFGEGLYNAVFGKGSNDNSSSGGSSGYYNSSTDLGYTNDPNLPSNVSEGEKLLGKTREERIWRYLRSLGYSRAGTAGIMGNLRWESGLRSNNLEDTKNKKFNMTDEAYTMALNNGSYSRDKFANDKGGYGLAQWTFGSRKKNLYDATIGSGKNISSEKDQLDLLSRELLTYGLKDSFMNASNVNAASDVFLEKFENPQGIEQTRPKRRQAAQAFYNQFSGLGRSKGKGQLSMQNAVGGSTGIQNTSTNFSTPRVQTTSSNINLPSKPTTNKLAYGAFLEAIVNILLSISSNTEALTKILNILSENFNIDISASDVQKTTKNAKVKAREALNTLMNDHTDAESVSHLLQSRDTDWLVRSMTELARE